MHSRKFDDRQLTFGVSGRLYKSNVLMYDHQTESLWSQLMEKAVSGPMVGSDLRVVPSYRTTWRNWKSRFPDTLVLSDDTGFPRNYNLDPYEGYYRVGTIIFPVGEVRRDLAAKTTILGIKINGRTRAYPLEDLKSISGGIRERIGEKTIQIDIDSNGQVAGVTDADGQQVDHLFAYWFAWQAFHPETTVYRKSD